MGIEEKKLRLRRRRAIILFILGMFLLSLSMFLSFMTIRGRPYTINAGPYAKTLERSIFVAIPPNFYRAPWVSPNITVLLKLRTNNPIKELSCYWIDINESMKYIGKLTNLLPEKEYLLINKTFRVSVLRNVVGFELINEDPELPANVKYEIVISGTTQLFPVMINYLLLFLTIIGFVLAVIGFMELIRSHAKLKYYYG